MPCLIFILLPKVVKYNEVLGKPAAAKIFSAGCCAGARQAVH
ncbi:hypothetical protein SUBVAR_06505 [Subdoligranulum variabile DSM 15176]|uniref:Uncharacterized protein n=1 Tax=Subdoligranulum variabile DSM 15176 TaxID=411471 RepID=D1PQ37_9FIRM|nr:hypothetical protein SUBVAR_06505 [Subdoligranulum variabile DSM 15176]